MVPRMVATFGLATIFAGIRVAHDTVDRAQRVLSLKCCHVNLTTSLTEKEPATAGC